MEQDHWQGSALWYSRNSHSEAVLKPRTSLEATGRHWGACGCHGDRALSSLASQRKERGWGHVDMPLPWGGDRELTLLSLSSSPAEHLSERADGFASCVCIRAGAWECWEMVGQSAQSPSSQDPRHCGQLLMLELPWRVRLWGEEMGGLWPRSSGTNCTCVWNSGSKSYRLPSPYQVSSGTTALPF